MNDCGISKLDLKRRNRMQILKVVREQGPISRVDISAILGITRAAVTIITNEMIDQHILQEVGEEPVNPNAEVRKGRRKILLDINETYKFAIGIYVDEKEISIGLTTLNAAALDKKSITHKADMTPEALAELYRLAYSLGLEVLVEVHNQEELEQIAFLEPQILGVNNRNLKTFEVSLDTVAKLKPFAPEQAVFVSESGIRNNADMQMVRQLGADAVLIGETLMRSDDIAGTLHQLREGV